MAHHPARRAMENSLKAIVVPILRERGFKGSFPHFRRRGETRIDLISFQFLSSGGSFVAEVARCGPEGTRFSGPDDAKVSEVAVRLRLGAADSKSDHWFTFGARNYEPGHDVVKPQSHYDAISCEVAELIASQAEAWFAEPSS